MAIDPEVRAEIDRLERLILANAEARNEADRGFQEAIRMLQQAVGPDGDGGGIAAAWALRGNVERIPSDKFAQSDAGLYSDFVKYDRDADGTLAGTPNPLVMVNAKNQFVIAADGPYGFLADEAVGWTWRNADGTEVFRADSPWIGVAQFRMGDTLEITSADPHDILIVRYGAVPRPVASVDNLNALIEAGGGIETSIVAGRLRIDATGHSSTFTRRAAWRVTDNQFTAADYIAGQVSDTGDFVLPSVAADAWLGIWIAGVDRVVTEIEIAGIEVLDRFAASPLSVLGVAGRSFVSKAPVQETFGESRIVIR